MRRVFGSPQCVSAGVRCEAESQRALHRLRTAIQAVHALRALPQASPKAESETEVKDVSIFPSGAQVGLVGSGEFNDIQGMVTAATIRSGGHVLYEVSYWVNGEHKSTWFDEVEITEGNKQSILVAFKGEEVK
jgi:hypothetical protein